MKDQKYNDENQRKNDNDNASGDLRPTSEPSESTVKGSGANNDDIDGNEMQVDSDAKQISDGEKNNKDEKTTEPASNQQQISSDKVTDSDSETIFTKTVSAPPGVPAQSRGRSILDYNEIRGHFHNNAFKAPQENHRDIEMYTYSVRIYLDNFKPSFIKCLKNIVWFTDSNNNEHYIMVKSIKVAQGIEWEYWLDKNSEAMTMPDLFDVLKTFFQ